MACPLVLPTIAKLDFITKENQLCKPEGDLGGLVWSDLGGGWRGEEHPLGPGGGDFFGLRPKPCSSGPWFPHSQGAAVPNDSQACLISLPIRPQRIQALPPLMSAL